LHILISITISNYLILNRFQRWSQRATTHFSIHQYIAPTTTVSFISFVFVCQKF